jgi:hypothetical protein
LLGRSRALGRPSKPTPWAALLFPSISGWCPGPATQRCLPPPTRAWNGLEEGDRHLSDSFPCLALQGELLLNSSRARTAFISTLIAAAVTSSRAQATANPRRRCLSSIRRVHRFSGSRKLMMVFVINLEVAYHLSSLLF